MDHHSFNHVRHIARQPFRALTAIVEFFAPWQKNGAGPLDVSQLHAHEAARQWRASPSSRAMRLVADAATQRRALEHTSARARNTALTAANQPMLPPARPLRVIRRVDAHTPANASGRMVISGRIADVCAELERLADAAQA
ncbi:MAG: hypothetical protein GAK30_02696 [Paracidovorax wautersii]|uniref:Uncharacterized protein n=1 Tax=Paracidovorax wautersii TaxID=1177982 RepID=A0A7V8JPW3_9BURK|nr:MAG: hypothetical protein GAK30_02696 [Paracidovorax wautersii]